MPFRTPLFVLAGAIALCVAASPAAAAPARDVTYTVKSGDTLSAIGARCHVSWQKIAVRNKLGNPSRIIVGQSLVVPGATSCAAAAAPKPRQAAPAEPAAPAAEAPVQAAPASPAPAGFGYGVQVHAPGGDQKAIDMVAGMGFNWIKQQVEWQRYEGSKGSYDFGGLDALVGQANAAGVNVLFSVVKAPGWARPGNSNFSVAGPPANPQDMADFMGALAGHFAGRVRAYEVWNEQNLWYEWGGEPLDASRYVQLLCACYRAIKAADPNAVVVSGALTPTGVNSSQAMDDVAYLRRMYAAGVRGCSNAIGAHPSGYNNPATAAPGSVVDPSEPTFKGHRSFYFRGTMESYRSVMASNGDGGKKIWATEFGWASTENMGAGPAGGYEYAAQNTEAEQAQYLVDAFNLAKRWGYVGPMFVWNLNFAPAAGAADEKAAFGLVRADWCPRPAYEALRNMPK